MERTRTGPLPLLLPAIVFMALAGAALCMLVARWFAADARDGLRHRLSDAATAAERQLDAGLRRQADATRALGTSPIVWLWVKFQGERLTASNRSHAQMAMDEVTSYAGLLPGATVYLASARTQTVYQGGAAVAALSRKDPRDSWYAASLAVEGVVFGDDPRMVRTSMRIMNGQTLLGAVSCVGDVSSIAAEAFAGSAEEPGMSFVLADKEGTILLARGPSTEPAASVFDLFDRGEQSNLRAAMQSIMRPSGLTVDSFASRGRTMLTALTLTAAPGWYVLVAAPAPPVPAARILISAGIAVAALALLVAALLLIALRRAARTEALVSSLESQRDSEAAAAREAAAATARMQSGAASLRERTAVLAAETAAARAASSETTRLLGLAEERTAELRAGITARLSLLSRLATSLRESTGALREAHAAAGSAGGSAAAAEEKVNLLITTGGAATQALEGALKGVEKVAETAERARLLALNATFEASRPGQQGGAQTADELRRIAEETAARVREIAASVEEARERMRGVGQSAQEAGQGIHEAASGSMECARKLDSAQQGFGGFLLQLESADENARKLQGDVQTADQSRSAAEGVARILGRIESLGGEVSALAAALAREAAQTVKPSGVTTARQGAPGEGTR